MQRGILVPMGTCLLLAGCATIISGRSQEMTINTSPQGAQCDIVRAGKGDLIARVVTPQTITIRKSKYDLRITCRKPGYQETVHFVKSEIEDATWGNIILGGGVGWAIDSAGGADNKYPRYVNISLPPAAADDEDDAKARGTGTDATNAPASTADAPEAKPDTQPQKADAGPSSLRADEAHPTGGHTPDHS